MNKEYVIESLRSNECVVEFTKKDGDFRRMRCTLKADSIPTEAMPKDGGAIVPSTSSAVRCYDLEANGWRSFIIENVTGFTLVESANAF